MIAKNSIFYYIQHIDSQLFEKSPNQKFSTF